MHTIYTVYDLSLVYMATVLHYYIIKYLCNVYINAFMYLYLDMNLLSYTYALIHFF